MNYGYCEFKNLTPHSITVIGAEAPTVIPPSGQIARVSVISTPVRTWNDILVVTQTPGPVTGLPEPESGTLLIVSAMVRQALPDRSDLLSPGELVRDASGQPVGCRGFVANF